MSADRPPGFVDAVAQGLDRCGIDRRARLLIACSGGPDSTALLLALHSLEPAASTRLAVGHFNHRLRGEESDGDEQFVRELCERLGVPLDVERGTPGRPAGESQLRDDRYSFLTRASRTSGAEFLLTAHTMDDQAETVLLNIVRGAGTRGAGGMRDVSERRDRDGVTPLRIARPLLHVRKALTAPYCRSLGVEPRHDSSNTDTRFARNRIRHLVIPQLEKINPGAVDALHRLSRAASADRALIDDIVARRLADATVGGSHTLARQQIVELPPALAGHVLTAAYRLAAGTLDGLTMEHISAMTAAANSHAGVKLDLPNNVRMRVEYSEIEFCSQTGAGAPSPYPPRASMPLRMKVPGSVEFADGAVLTARVVECPATVTPRSRWHTYATADLRDELLTVRRRESGDRFQPLGMSEQVRLQDFFVNQHVPERWRDQVPLVTSARGIIWVAGHRLAEWAKVSGQPDEVAEFELLPSATEYGPAAG